jgi:anaerobic selenocysteine-containing dehydrogenase
MRLVASRTLYDLGVAASSVPALAGLVATAPLRVNPHDLDALGVADGGSVRLRTASASMVMAAVPDGSLPRKVVAADFNVPLGEGTIADLIEVGAPVVEVRMETP